MSRETIQVVVDLVERHAREMEPTEAVEFYEELSSQFEASADALREEHGSEE